MRTFPHLRRIPARIFARSSLTRLDFSGMPRAHYRFVEVVMITLRNVLVATDFGEPAGTALTYGRELARRFHATLHLLHVVDDLSARVVTATGLPYDVSAAQRDIEAVARRQLNGLLTGEHGELAVKTVQLTSASPAGTIVSYAADAHVD